MQFNWLNGVIVWMERNSQILLIFTERISTLYENFICKKIIFRLGYKMYTH